MKAKQVCLRSWRHMDFSLTFQVQKDTTDITAAQPEHHGSEDEWCVVGDDEDAGDDAWVEHAKGMCPQVFTISGGLQ